MDRITRSWFRPLDPRSFPGSGPIHAARSDARSADPDQDPEQWRRSRCGLDFLAITTVPAPSSPAEPTCVVCWETVSREP